MEQRHEEFRASVQAAKLAQDQPNHAKNFFFFDLNMGQLYADPNPESVMEIIRLALKAAEDESYGEHHALLALVADRTKIHEQKVYWRRPYHLPDNNSDRWISLEQWLKDQGQDPDSLFSAEYLAYRKAK